jgi:transposase
MTDLMTKTVEERVVELHRQGWTREDIRKEVKCGTARIQRAIQNWKGQHTIPEPLPLGRPRKVTERITTFIEVRTLQEAPLAGSELVLEIINKFSVELHPSTGAKVRRGLSFEYQRPRHAEALTEAQMADRVEFCQKMLDQGGAVLCSICFSDESRIV